MSSIDRNCVNVPTFSLLPIGHLPNSSALLSTLQLSRCGLYLSWQSDTRFVRRLTVGVVSHIVCGLSSGLCASFACSSKVVLLLVSTCMVSCTYQQCATSDEKAKKYRSAVCCSWKKTLPLRSHISVAIARNKGPSHTLVTRLCELLISAAWIIYRTCEALSIAFLSNFLFCFAFLQKTCNQSRPACLMACPYTSSVVAVKVFIE